MPNRQDALVDTDFKTRVRIAWCESAVDVMSEDASTANHAERVVFAGKILYGDMDNYTLTAVTMTNPTVSNAYVAGTNISDSDLKFTTNSLFDAFALSA